MPPSVVLVADCAAWTAVHWSFFASTVRPASGTEQRCIIIHVGPATTAEGDAAATISQLHEALSAGSPDVQALSPEAVEKEAWKESAAPVCILASPDLEKASALAAHAAKTVGAASVAVWTWHGGLYTADPARMELALLLHSVTHEDAQTHPLCLLPPPFLHVLQELAITVQFFSPVFGPGTSVIPDAPPAQWIDQPGWQLHQMPAASLAALPSSPPLFATLADGHALVALPFGAQPPAGSTPSAASLVRVHGIDPAAAAHVVAEAHGRILAMSSSSQVALLVIANLDDALATLHEGLFPPAHWALQAGDGMGPCWAKLASCMSSSTVTALAAETDDVTQLPPTHRWWWSSREKLMEMAPDAVPLYVYSLQAVRDEIAAVRMITSVHRFFYAMKANANPDILRTIETAGFGFECVSLGELKTVLAMFPAIPRERILFTPNFAPRTEYAWALEAGVHVTVDNTYCIRTWPDLFRGHKILLRCEVGAGHGHHVHVRTGSASKFAISPLDLAEIAEICQKNKITVLGLHTHSGSGVADPELWAQHAATLAAMGRKHFPHARLLNLGGGLGHAYKFGSTSLDPSEVQLRLAKAIAQLDLQDWELWMEPGRRLVAGAGILLTRVTQIKQKKHTTYVGVNAGMHNLLRPALYNSHHAIVNISRGTSRSPRHIVHVCGPICESADVLGRDRSFPVDTAEGDVVVIDSAGAYGACMASPYNLRGPAAEVSLESV